MVKEMVKEMARGKGRSPRVKARARGREGKETGTVKEREMGMARGEAWGIGRRRRQG